MDIYSLLRQEHQRIRELFDRIEALQVGAEERASLFKQLARELRAHKEAEASTFYAALGNLPELSERVEEAIEEHVDIEELLDELATVEYDSPPFIAQLSELKEEFDHHTGEEEGEIFRRAQQLLTQEQADRLGADMEAEKTRLTT